MCDTQHVVLHPLYVFWQWIIELETVKLQYSQDLEPTDTDSFYVYKD